MSISIYKSINFLCFADTRLDGWIGFHSNLTQTSKLCTLYNGTPLSQISTDFSRYSATVSKQTPIDNLWIMRSSRALAICGRPAFFVELNELMPFSIFKIPDMTLKNGQHLFQWPKETVHHSSLERLGVGVLQLPWSD